MWIANSPWKNTIKDMGLNYTLANYDNVLNVDLIVLTLNANF